MAGRGPVAALLDTLVPAGVATAAIAFDEATPAPDVDAREADAVARAVPLRQREFAFGRACARHALAALGEPAHAIPRGAGGAPVWPAGVIGSITHVAGLAAAAVTRAGALASLGIDVESIARAGEVELLGMVSTATERDRHATWTGADLPLGALLFSAKESVYKCLYPQLQRFLEFGEVELALDRATGTFSVLHVAGHDPRGLHGRFAVTDGLIATVVVQGSGTTSTTYLRTPDTASG